MKVVTIGVVALLAMMVPVIAGAQQRVEAASSPDDQPPFDTLVEAERLEDGGFTSEQASTLTKTVAAATENLPTRTDLQLFEARLEVGMAELETRLSDRFTDLMLWGLTIGIGGAGLTVAAIGVLPSLISRLEKGTST